MEHTREWLEKLAIRDTPVLGPTPNLNGADVDIIRAIVAEEVRKALADDKEEDEPERDAGMTLKYKQATIVHVGERAHGHVRFEHEGKLYEGDVREVGRTDHELAQDGIEAGDIFTERGQEWLQHYG